MDSITVQKYSGSDFISCLPIDSPAGFALATPRSLRVPAGASWQRAAAKSSEAGEVLKREWKILRDSMRQALKRTKRGATTKAGTPCKKWRFESRMAFVLPYMTVRRNDRQIKDTDVKIDDSEEAPPSDQESEAWDPGSDQDSLELFFASICQSAKRLPRRLQHQLKRQTLDSLLRLEEELEDSQALKPGDTKNF